MTSYFFKDINISNIISSGSVNPTSLGNITYFNDFPTSVSTNYQIYRPLNLNYIINGTDVANNCKAIVQKYTAPVSSLRFPETANYISAICVGGGGGGGGSGGNSRSNNLTLGTVYAGSGGSGAPGGYTAMGKYQINRNKTFDLYVGSGGTGGPAGDNFISSSTSFFGTGTSGSPGNSGNDTYIDVKLRTDNTTSTVIRGRGGGRGNGSPPGSVNSITGNTDSTPTSFYQTYYASYGTASYDNTYPKDTDYGNGGSGGSAFRNTNIKNNNGSTGTSGYIEIILLYD